MPVISSQVWKLLVSPKDKNLKSRYELNVNGQKITVDLYNSNEKLLQDDFDDDERSINSRKKLSKYKCFKREDKYVTRYYLARLDENSRMPMGQRKLIVIFPGRNFSLTQIKKIKYFEKMYKTNEIGEYDCAIMIYPIKAKDLRMLAESSERALSHLIEEHGYRHEHVFIMGWCLGGYFANETLNYYREVHPGMDKQFGCYINNKSFSSINEFLHFVLPTKLRFLLNFNPVKFYVRKWNADTAESLERFRCLFKQLFVVYTDNDNIINELSHLYKHLNVNDAKSGGDESNEKRNLEILEDLEQQTHLPNWNLVAKLFNSAAVL
jgi:hypothetical protein